MITINGLSARAARLVVPWIGAWVLDLDVDLATVPVVPSGKATVLVGAAPNVTTLVGTVDADHSGRFGETARVRVIGGGGGWRKNVRAIDFSSGAVTTATVIAATAAEVGEVAIVAAPEPLGDHFVRVAGPASQVLSGRTWFVTFAGVTTVGPRVPIPYDPTDVDILEWDAEHQIARVALERPIVPGTVLADSRFGTATVRDCEFTFGADGARGVLHCGPTSDTLGATLRRMVETVGGVATLRMYAYLVIGQTPDGLLSLRPANPGAGAPDLVRVRVHANVPGIAAKVTPAGSTCIVAFADGDPTRPIVLGFDVASPPPVKLSLSAASVEVGPTPSSPTVPVALAPPIVTWAASVVAALAAASITVPPLAVCASPTLKA